MTKYPGRTPHHCYHKKLEKNDLIYVDLIDIIFARMRKKIQEKLNKNELVFAEICKKNPGRIPSIGRTRKNDIILSC